MHRIASILTMMLVPTIPFAADTIHLEATEPVALAFAADGSMYVLDGNAGRVGVVRRSPNPSFAARIGTVEGIGHLSHPVDLAVDKAGNVVVADAGNYRVAVFRPSGEFVSEVSLDGHPILQRIVALADGSTRILYYDGASKRLMVSALNRGYERVATFGVDSYCEVRGANSPMGDLAVDDDGSLWIVDLHGCNDEYTLRKYDPKGAVLGTWSHPAGQVSIETQKKRNYLVRIVSGIFAAQDEIFVVLGAGGAETGGLDVDVWTKKGSILRRSKLVGPARGGIRATARDGKVFVTDVEGLKTISSVDLSSL